MNMNVFVRENSHPSEVIRGSAIMPEASRILDKMLSSDAKADLLILFNKYPNHAYNTDEIAERIGKAGAKIDKDLKDLIELGLISRKKARRSDVIRYNRRRATEIQRILATYITKTLE
jgi:predicted transcriptional regulator